MINRIIPSTGNKIPIIGIGTWKTFDVHDTSANTTLQKVLEQMYDHGGRLIDSSPMYGHAETVIGDITAVMKQQDDFFYATKIWTTGRQQGISQMETSMHRMKRKTIDLMQVHNLTDIDTHLPTLKEWKEQGKIKYTGITHYTDDMHEELERRIKKDKVDFVQFNYSIQDTHAEKRLLPAAAELGVATLINRPFGTGKIFQLVAGKSLPAWANEIGITTWAAFFLKYIMSHPAVTCIIPATGDPQHAMDNFSAGSEPLPDEGMRQRMLDYFRSIC